MTTPPRTMRAFKRTPPKPMKKLPGNPIPIDLPGPSVKPTCIVAGPDGNIWYTRDPSTALNLLKSEPAFNPYSNQERVKELWSRSYLFDEEWEEVEQTNI